MFITKLSTTCFGAYGHLQVDEITKNINKQLHLACVFCTEDWGRGYQPYDTPRVFGK